MPVVRFTPNLERHLSVPTAEVEAETVRAALDGVFDSNPRLRSYLLDDQGRLRRHVNVFVNGQAVDDRSRLTDKVTSTDEIFVIQSLTGG